uniref:Zinc finger C3HC-type containing 1 n=1 Tax=Chinchilla lanigera TaxID=34839 RepID=A0A8C2VCH1_CHILA
MAAPSQGEAFAAGAEKNWGVVRSPEGTPQKVRQLIDEGIAPEEGGAEPPELSPLVCAKYGWVTVECDMLKCSSCQAFLCASLQPAFDFDRYKERCDELKKSLCTAHEKFCFWPDSPCPGTYFQEFPSTIFPGPFLLLNLLEDELDHQADEKKATSKLGSDIQVHVTACILSVCGWACSSPFAGPEGRPERFPPVPESPRRIMTRSQDATFSPCSEQAEKSPGPTISRTRSWDSSSPVERPEPEAASPTPRTRPVTRSMGTGDAAGLEVPSSPLRRAKRARLCSSGSLDTSRSFFDPTCQHRDWCPWVNSTLGREAKENGGPEQDASAPAEPGWKAVLSVLLARKQSNQPAEADSMSLSEKSRKVFRIFRQWESLCSS